MVVQSVSTGNEEVDRQFGGGIPIPSLMLIEGDHGTGKSSMAAQFIRGLLNANKRVLFITTESGIKEYIEKMAMITFDFRRDFIQNRLSIMPINVDGLSWSPEQSKLLMPVIGRFISVNAKKADVTVIDSLSALTMYCDTNTTLDFFTKCKNFVSKGMTVIITMHPKAVTDDVALRVRSTCDGYMRITPTTIAGRSVKVMEIIKMIGSSSQVSSQFSFDVDQSFGIKIVPLSMANA
ncbi:MAG TPA: ATPase domain-containing protein [Nitrososphaera sp.]|nr:ATPase domain-containing protein [Nitrososphaera sp.]